MYNKKTIDTPKCYVIDPCITDKQKRGVACSATFDMIYVQETCVL